MTWQDGLTSYTCQAHGVVLSVFLPQGGSVQCVLDGGEVRPYWLHGEGEGCADREEERRGEEQVRGKERRREEQVRGKERRREEQVRGKERRREEQVRGKEWRREEQVRGRERMREEQVRGK